MAKLSPFGSVPNAGMNGFNPVPEGQPLVAAATSPSPLGAPRRRSNHTRHPTTGKFIKGSKGRFGV